MRISLILYLGWILCHAGEAQIVDRTRIGAHEIPKLVKLRFDSLVGSLATSAEWFKAGFFNYEVNFVMDKQAQQANIRIDGTLVARRYKVEWNALPDKVRQGVKEDSPGFEINESFDLALY